MDPEDGRRFWGVLHGSRFINDNDSQVLNSYFAIGAVKQVSDVGNAIW